MKLYALLGAGGFGREVMPLVETMLKQQNSAEKSQLVFIDQKYHGTTINNIHVITIDEFFSHSATEKYFNITIANSQIRKKLVELMLKNQIKPFHINAFNAIDLVNNQIKEGAIFCPFTIVTANAKIGKFFHANIYSYIAHDCIIGDYVTFAPHVQCNGSVIIEDHVYVGTGVIIREGTPSRPMIIGKNAILGMGAVITKSVPAHETVIGNPAHPLKVKVATKENA